MSAPAGRQETIPRLRFPGFPEIWEPKKLKKIAKFSKGKGIAKADISPTGATPCIRYGELYTHYGSLISDVVSRTSVSTDDLILSSGNEVIIPASGETAIDIATASAVIQKGVALGGDLNIIRSPHDPRFLANYLSSGGRYRLAALAQGVSVVHLYADQLGSLDIYAPSLPEQKKIADFLGAVDDKITKLAEKKALLERYKKGMMQKLFSQSLRFKDDNGQDYPDWEERRLSDILEYHQPTPYLVETSEYCAEGVPVLTAGKTFVLGFTQEKTGHFDKLLPTIIFDDFTTDFKFVDFKFKAKSSAMKMLTLESSADDIRFVFAAMQGVRFVVSEHKRHWISEYQNEKIPCPCPEEQRKIADFLTAIDDKINLVSDELNQAKQFKKGLLQQMFV